MVGFDIEAKLKSERIQNVKDDDMYLKLLPEQQRIVDALLKIYEISDVMAIEDLRVLDVPAFNDFGGFIPTIKKMDGKAKYLSFVGKMIEKLYE